MKAIIFTLALFFSIDSFSQAKEYIVKHDGDTVSGEVKVFTKQIKVIKAPADTLVLNAEDVKYYVRNKAVKTVLRGPLYGYTDNIQEIESSSYSNPVYDTTILLTHIITGEKLNLFSAKDKRGTVYFFVQSAQDRVPIQLLYSIGGDMPEKETWTKLYRYVNYITHHRLFEMQLWKMVSDCDHIRPANIWALDYRESSFKAFVKRYNNKCR